MFQYWQIYFYVVETPHFGRSGRGKRVTNLESGTSLKAVDFSLNVRHAVYGFCGLFAILVIDPDGGDASDTVTLGHR